MLKESYLLECRYDSRVSFYGKARVEVMENGAIALISYNTNVAIIKDNEAYINGTYSQTTLRHIKEFLKQHNFKAINKEQILKDYLIDDDELFYGLLDMRVKLYKNNYNIFCYSDENGDNLVFVESCQEYDNAIAIADKLYQEYKRVEILDEYGEKVY